MFRSYRVLSLVLLLTAFGAASVWAAGDPPMVGQPAPDFNLKSNEGKSVSLKDFRGKWVVLYF